MTNDPKLSQNQNQNTRNVSRLKEQTYNVACQVRQPTPEAVPISGEQGKSGSQSGQTIDQRQSNGLHASGSEDAQPRQTTDRKRALAEGDKKGREKDPKSFTQNLFDTFAVRMLELLPVPSLLNDEQSKMEGKEDSSSLTGPDSETQSRPSNKLDHSQSEIKKPGNTYVSESKVKPRSHSVTARLRVKPASVSHQSSLSMPLKASKQRDLGQPDELKQESLHRDPSWRQQTPRQQAAHDAPQPRIPNNSTESDDTDLSETRNTRHNTAAEVSDSSRTWGQLKTWGAQTHGSRAPASRTDRPEMVRDRRHSSNLGVHQFENIISESGSPTTADLDLNATSVTVHPVGLGSANEPSNLPPTIQNGYGEDGANHVLDVAIKPGGSTSLTRPTSYRTSSLSQPTSSTLHQEKDLKMTPASLPVTGPPRLGRTKSAIPTEIDPSGGQLPQTLSHLSLDIIKALVDITTLSDEIAEDPILFMKLALSRGGKIPKRTAVRQHRRALQFAAQSLFYVMSTPEALIQSFRKPLQAGMDLTDGDPVIRSCHPYEIDQAIRLLKKIDRPKIIFRSLWIALGALFAPLPDISHPKSPKLKAAINTSKSRSPGPSDEVDPVSPHVSSTYYPDREAVHIVKLALSALVAAIPNSSVETMRAVHKLRASGKVAPDEHLLATHAHLVRPLLEVTDVLEDELALRLTSRLVQAVAARCCAAEITKNKQVRKRGNIRRENRPVDILELLRDYLREARQPLPGANGDNDHILNSGTSATDGVAANWSMSTITVEWLRSVLLKEWDGKAEFARWGVVGGAVMILASLCTPLMFDYG